MTMKEIVKDIITEKNPLVRRRRAEMRKALTNTTPTFLCPNCIGGILFHDLGLQFRSPTINTMMLQPDFAKFALHLDDYLNQELKFFKHPEYDCPCAHLGDVTIHFTHYRTEEEARSKWNERAARIDRNNLFIFLEERDGLTRADMEAMGAVSAKGLVIFTAHSYPELPYTLCLDRYNAEGEVGNILAKSWADGSREYEKYFDFVKWFNESDGKDLDIHPYLKKERA